MASNISATLTSEDILALAKKPEIIAIEPDEEVHAL
ncbi:protease inhibitor I9 family protein [Porphyromonas cangingivalis]|nr:protease inhibitor I9 family protein [Porphyromonas cangingivalis]